MDSNCLVEWVTWGWQRRLLTVAGWSKGKDDADGGQLDEGESDR